MEERKCVRCGKALPGMSKMAEEKVTPLGGAEEWLGRAGGGHGFTDGSDVFAVPDYPGGRSETFLRTGGGRRRRLGYCVHG